MEMNKAMKMFVENEVALASAKWIHQAMSALQIENKEKTMNHFLDELKDSIADERVNYVQGIKHYRKNLFIRYKPLALPFILPFHCPKRN